jgi:hypothetical protein
VAARLYCETCVREVWAAHRISEPLWLHRVTLLPVALLDGAQHNPTSKLTRSYEMPTKKSLVKRPPKDTKVPPKATKAAVKETPKERMQRLAEEKKAKARK